MSLEDEHGLASLRRGPPDAAPNVDDLREFYDALTDIQPQGDRWLKVQNDWIQQFVTEELCVPPDSRAGTCLNLGSGGLSYGLPEAAILHVDLSPTRFAADQHVLVADIQHLPASVRGFNYGLCVGSVLNHCDAAALIVGAAAAIRTAGTFLVEFETSASLELLGSHHFGRAATVIHTFYQGNSIKLWAYSERYIRTLLESNGFVVTRRSSCHHVSPLVYGVTRSSNFAARFHVLDAFARRLPLINRYPCHVIYACRKAG